MTLEKLSHIRGTRPTITSCSAGAGPLKGTWSRSILAVLFSSSPHKWPVEPGLPEAYASAPGLALACARRSPIVFTGESGWATHMLGVLAALITGVRSFLGS